MMHPDRLQSRTGTYALVFECRGAHAIGIGKLGTLDLTPGYYIYVGSAFGPGGIRARIKHHINRSMKPHWHIDYLKSHCRLDEIWIEYSDQRHESMWVAELAGSERTTVPLNGFGASDGDADSHLFYFNSPPASDLLPADGSLRIKLTTQ